MRGNFIMGEELTTEQWQVLLDAVDEQRDAPPPHLKSKAYNPIKPFASLRVPPPKRTPCGSCSTNEIDKNLTRSDGGERVCGFCWAVQEHHGYEKMKEIGGLIKSNIEKSNASQRQRRL